MIKDLSFFMWIYFNTVMPLLHSSESHDPSELMFLEHQIIILEWFLKDHVTLKTDAENSALITGKKYILIYITIENSHFKA